MKAIGGLILIGLIPLGAHAADTGLPLPPAPVRWSSRMWPPSTPP